MKGPIPKCPLGLKHKYEWVKDVTIVRVTARARHYSRRGVYRCACGQERNGMARSGL